MEDLDETEALLQHATFSVMSSDNVSRIALIPDGAHSSVPAARAAEYVSLALAARLTECAAQVHAMRMGFASVVPIGAATLFSWCDKTTLAFAAHDAVLLCVCGGVVYANCVFSVSGCSVSRVIDWRAPVFFRAACGCNEDAGW